MIKNMKEEISSFKIKLDNVFIFIQFFLKLLFYFKMKLNFSFDSIENINRNIHFFDEKLLRQKSEKQKNKQMSLLNAFQQNLNVKGANSQKFDFGGLFGSANNENINSLETRNNENEDIGDPIFFKTWDILLQSKVFLIFYSLIFKGFDDECKKIFQNENGEDIYEKK